jgi:hypothetical protein
VAKDSALYKVSVSRAERRMTFGVVSLLFSNPLTVYKTVRLYRPDMSIGKVIDFDKSEVIL